MNGIERRTFFKWAGASALPFIFSGCRNEPAEGTTKPNIIFILADDLGYGDLGCYGQETVLTPNIDRLAAEGIRFTQHYAGSTVCAPSRCVLMTGYHTGHALVRGNSEVKPMGQWPLPAETITFPKLLRMAGYTTGLIGKWGLGGPDSSGTPNRQGFDYFFGYLCQRHAHNYYPEFLFRNNKRIPLEGNVVEDPRPDGAGKAEKKTQYSHDLLLQEALEFLDRNKDNPFFLYLAVTIPHANNEAGEEGMEVPSLEPYTDKDWPNPQKGHAAMITRLDAGIGALIARLKRLGIDENTLVIFTSDNGPHREGGADPDFFQSSGPLRGIKRDLYEGGIRVPLIARWPGTIKPGQTSDHISAFWDWLPTLVDLAGAPGPPMDTDGISLKSILTGRPGDQPAHDFLYWEFAPRETQALRWGDWKVVRFLKEDRIELYDLADDVGETRNLAAARPDIAAQMVDRMKMARVPSERFPLLIDSVSSAAD